MLYPYANCVFSVPVVFCSKAHHKANYSINEYWNVAAKRHRDALWVSLSMPTDCVVPLDKGMAIVCAARLAANIDKLTEHAISTRIKH